MPVKVAITYNPEVGGSSVKSLQKAMTEIGTTVVDADYRKILPLDAKIDRIYEDKALLEKTFQYAKTQANEFLKDKDCLMLSGNSAMIDPKLFGGNRSGDKLDLERSIAEAALIHVAMQKGMPILGICGGHQILNVYLGGNITALNEKQLSDQGFMSYGKVNINPKSELAQILTRPKEVSDKQVVENLFGAHRQVVQDIGAQGMIAGKQDLLKVVATSATKDKSIEAVESQFGQPIIGLQFHPEVGAKGLPGNEVLYQASSPKEIEKNKNVFLAFKKSAETYQNKKMVLEQIKILGQDKEGGPLKDKLQRVEASSKDILQTWNAEKPIITNNNSPIQQPSKFQQFLSYITAPFKKAIRWVVSKIASARSNNTTTPPSVSHNNVVENNVVEAKNHKLSRPMHDILREIKTSQEVKDLKAQVAQAINKVKVIEEHSTKHETKNVKQKIKAGIGM